MALEGTDVSSLTFRRPWYWLVLMFVAASLATWLIVADAQSRTEQNVRQFDSNQKLRLQLTNQRIDNYFLGAMALTAAGAEMLGPKPVSKDAARDIVASLYRSRKNPDPNPSIYGVGVFYAPYAFSSGWREFEIYVHAAAQPGEARSPYDASLPGHAAEIVQGSNSRAHEFDYTQWPWYRRAVAKPGVTVFHGPYMQDGAQFHQHPQSVHAG